MSNAWQSAFHDYVHQTETPQTGSPCPNYTPPVEPPPVFGPTLTTTTEHAGMMLQATHHDPSWINHHFYFDGG